MDLLTRRSLALTLASALGALVIGPHAAFADATEEEGVDAAIEALRLAMLSADRAKLEELVFDELSYGHSNGNAQTKSEFIAVIADKKTIYKSIQSSEQNIKLVGNDAIVRHILATETDSAGKTNEVKVGAMQVWKKQDGRWKLFARRAFRLPA
jgi:ketosteroid isomerase-like protein